MSGKIVCVLLCMCAVTRTQVIPGKSRTNEGDYNSVNTDGSFDFGYTNKDAGGSYHLAHGNANKVVGGRFGARDPATGTVKETVYTAGARGFRAKGPNVHRKMDLDQRPRGPIGTKDDPYADPNEDPSYEFKINTRTYSKTEAADARGDVKGHYSYVDDIGERHDVTYIAGRDTGFHVSSANPDNPNVIGSPFHRSPLVKAERKQRGRTAVQRGLDGSYRFISAGPDQRRTESSDAKGNVRGSYTFLDDKGVQRTVHYIAGPGIGYRIVKNGKDPYIPAYFPTIPSAYDPDFVNAAAPPSFSPDDTGSDDVFKGPDGTAASGHVKPPPFPVSDKDRPGKKPGSSSEDLGNDTGFNQPSSGFGSGTQGSSGFGSGSPSSAGFGNGNQGSNGFGSGSQSTPGYGSGNQGPSGFGSGNQGTGGFGSETQGSVGFGQGNQGGENDGTFQPDEDASFAGQEFEVKPTIPSGRPPSRPGRPTAKPFGTTTKPYVPLKPFQKPPVGSSGPIDPVGYFDDTVSSGYPISIGGGYPGSSSSSGYPSDTGPTGYPSTTGRPSRPGSSGRPGGSGPSGRPGGSGSSGRPNGSGSSGRPGSRPPGRPGSSGSSGRPSSSGYPGPVGSTGYPSSTVSPNYPGPIVSSGYPSSTVSPGYPSSTGSTVNIGGAGYDSVGGNEAGGDGNSGPEYAIGFNIHNGNPGTTFIHEKPGTTIIYTKPGTTIIRNIGQDYFGIPPGVSVRAHVQSIDLYPYDSKPLSPSEALEQDKT